MVVETAIETDDESESEAVAEAGAERAAESESDSKGEFGAAVGAAAGAEGGFETETVSATAPGFVSEPGTGPGAEADARVDAETDAGADAGVGSEDVGTEGEYTSEAEAEAADAAVADAVAEFVEVRAEESGGVTADESAPTGSVGAAAWGQEPKGGPPKGPSPKGDPDGPTDGGTRQGRSAEAVEEPVPALTAEEDDASGKSVAVRGHERATAAAVPAISAPARSTGMGELTRVEPSGRVGHVRQAEPAAPSALPALPSLPTAGHFTVPTAVAVAPAAPQRRAVVQGGFDFFGTQKGADALEAVQNEDLADVVGQEALALHKAESEAQFKHADEESRGVGQVIDLTAHDETEQIDVQSLRTAAS